MGFQIMLSTYKLVRLKSGLARVASFDESPEFLDKSSFTKTQKSGFLGEALFGKNPKVRVFWPGMKNRPQKNFHRLK